MRYNKLKFIIFFILNVALCTAVDISSKLDFDNLETSEKSNTYKAPSYKGYRNENEKTNEELTNIGVVSLCTENCSVPHSKDSVETDVVVHVKTKVELNSPNRNVTVDDSSDVPIIIGSGGENHNDNDNVIGVMRPIGTQYSHFQSNIHSGSLFKGIDSYPSTKHIVNANLQPSSTVELKTAERRIDSDRRTQNTLNLPHLEASYRRHYFGESPPPQVVWYPKTTEFNLRPPVKPAFRNLDTFSSPTQNYHVGPGVTCTCKKDVPEGLQWYPIKRTYNTAPRSHISDKLAPLD